MTCLAGLWRAGWRTGPALLLACCGLAAQGQQPAPPAPAPAQDVPEPAPPKQEPVDPAKAGGRLLRDWIKKKQPEGGAGDEPGPAGKEGSGKAGQGAGAESRPATKPAVPPDGGQGKAGGAQEPVDPASEAGRLFRGEKLPAGEKPQPAGEAPTGPGAAAGPTVGPGAGAAAALEAGPSFHGSLDLWYRGRFASNDDADHEGDAILTAALGDERRDRWSARFRGRLIADLDGKQSDNVFNGLKETWNDDVIGRLYELSVQVRDVGPFETARLGRQEIIETPEPAYLDGLRLRTAAHGDQRIRGEGYLGLATRLYDSSWHDAWIGGLDAEAEPWRGARFRFDWMHVEEDRDDGGKRIDDLLALSGWQYIDADYRLEGRISMVSGRGRDLYLASRGRQPELDLSWTLSYFELLTAQRQLVTEFDLFTTAEFTYYPYRQLRAALTKDLARDLSLDLGVDVRRLKDEADEARYNREWDRMFVTASWAGLFDDTTTVALTLDGYDSSGEDFYAGNLDVRVRPEEGLELAAGSLYSLYKFDWVTLDEKDHVRTWYFGARWEAGEDWRLRFRYEYEDDDIGRFQTLRIGVTWTF